MEKINELSKKTIFGFLSLIFIGLAFAGVTKVVGVSRAQAASCIVTIFGVQYDVAPLQTGHSGGNIFTCNTDMTAVYQGMHGTNVSRIAPYLYTQPTPTLGAPSPTITPTPLVTPTPTITPSSTITPTPGASHDEIDDEDDTDEAEDENEVEDENDDDSNYQEDHDDRNESHSRRRDNDRDNRFSFLRLDKNNKLLSLDSLKHD